MIEPGFLAAGYLVTRIALSPTLRFLEKRDLHRRNYRGSQVITASGLALVPALVPLSLWLGLQDGPGTAVGLLVVGGGLALAGLWDDLKGEEKEIRGWRAHLSYLVSGRFSGGALKILLGGVSALGGAMLGGPGSGAIAGGAVIALFSNSLNQLDLRPGRAWKVLLLMTVMLIPWITMPSRVIWLTLAGGGLALIGPELQERLMLGDTGANLLGGIWAYGLYLSLETVWLIPAALALFLLQLLLDRFSLSGIIDRNPWLRAADLWGNNSNPDPQAED